MSPTSIQPQSIAYNRTGATLALARIIGLARDNKEAVRAMNRTRITGTSTIAAGYLHRTKRRNYFRPRSWSAFCDGCHARDDRELNKETPMAKRSPAKRELIDTRTDKRYVRRDQSGKFKESDDVGRSLAQDRRRTATTKSRPGQGDKGDR